MVNGEESRMALGDCLQSETQTRGGREGGSVSIYRRLTGYFPLLHWDIGLGPSLIIIIFFYC